MKEVSQLTAADLRKHPVWKFTGSDERGETLVRAVKRLPARSLDSSIVGADVVLSSGKRMLAMIGNVHVRNPRLTEHFVSLSFYRDDGEVFHLPRYHDPEFSTHGPAHLAAFLGLKKEDIFPIAWDVSGFASGPKEALSGLVEEEPRERLTRAQVIALAVP